MLLRLPQTPVPGCLTNRSISVILPVLHGTCVPHPHTCLSSYIASLVCSDVSQVSSGRKVFSFLCPLANLWYLKIQSSISSSKGTTKMASQVITLSGDPSFVAFSVPIPIFPHYIILSIPWGRASIDNFYFLPILSLNKNAILLSG